MMFRPTCFFILALLAGLGWAGAGRATVITAGSPVVAAPSVDTCGNCAYILNQPFGQSGGVVTSFSVYATGAGYDITPLLFTSSNPDANDTSFKLVGIGAMAVTTGAGLNSFAFNLVSGTNVALANTFFGFSNSNGGVVEFSYTGSAVNGGTYLLSSVPGLGGSYTSQNYAYYTNAQDSLNNRVYSAQAVAVPVPEPATILLLAGGVAGVAMLRRRRPQPGAAPTRVSP